MMCSKGGEIIGEKRNVNEYRNQKRKGRDALVGVDNGKDGGP